MSENAIASSIVDVAYTIHTKWGPGLLETAYHDVLVYELRKRVLFVQSREPVLIQWDGLVFDRAFQADLVVEHKVVVELKSVEETHPVHVKQLLTYLRLLDLRLGLLINFGAPLIKDGVKRIVNQLPE